MTARKPLVGIPCDHRMMGPHPFHMVGEKYIAAVHDGADALPVLIPVTATPLERAELLATVDGLLFTGSPSNVAPKHYGGTPPREGVLQDERRDATTLPLLTEAIAAAVPTLCICRGFQELNVARGGTLFQHVEEQPGRLDHREDKHAALDVQYGPAHDVAVRPGGLLHRIVGRERFAVNSLHGQGIDRLGDGLAAEATAPDGQIEAVSLPAAPGFLLGVQWHPEWRFWENAESAAIFRAFGQALRTRTKGAA